MTIERTEQSRMVKGYEITVAVNDPDFWQIKEIDEDLTAILDHIEESLACFEEARN